MTHYNALGYEVQVDPSSLLSDESELISGCAWAVASSGPPMVAYGGTITTHITEYPEHANPSPRFFVYEFRTVLFIVRRAVTAPNPNFHENKPLQGTTIILIFYILS